MALVMDVIDPARINRDAFCAENLIIALLSVAFRVAYHVLSLVVFFCWETSHLLRSNPYSFCDVNESINTHAVIGGESVIASFYDPWVPAYTKEILDDRSGLGRGSMYLS